VIRLQAPEGRFLRITELLSAARPNSMTPADFARIHSDRITLTADPFLSLLFDSKPAFSPSTDPEKAALALLSAWRSTPIMDKDLPAPLIYVLLRVSALQLLESLPGTPLGKIARTEDPHMGELDGMAKLLAVIGGKQWGALSNWVKARNADVLPKGYDWAKLMGEAFKKAVEVGVERFGPDLGSWRYGSVHKSAPKHAANALLSEEVKEKWNAVPMEMGGDADTVQAAGGWEEVVLQSVAR